ncbi:hypothetical protein BDL97_12G019000 [Sphagnum fallax]|nr:hypothetical protein BDL97_12G019000 [Sphagnum fallax]
MAPMPDRTTLVYMLVVAAFLALVLFSNHPSHHTARKNRRFMPGRRIKVRVASVDPKQHEPIAFDPIIAEYERRRDDRAWEKHYFEQQYRKWAEMEAVNQAAAAAAAHDADSSHLHVPEKQQQPEPWDTDFNYDETEYFLNDEEQFNITDRLIVLFPLLDINPTDGFVSLSELEAWHWLQAQKSLQHRTDREMDVHDKNNDGRITFKEYLPHLTEEELEKNSMDTGGAGWYRKQFDVNDEDKDAGLNRTEFNKLRDIKNDGKLDWDEFHNNVFDQVRDTEAEEHVRGHDYLQHPSQDIQSQKIVESKAKFAELDKNNDGFLTEDEMVPIMVRLYPSEGSYARQQAEHLLNEADEDKDKRLTLNEMLNHPYVFYSTAYDNEEYEDFHDEFR